MHERRFQLAIYSSYLFRHQLGLYNLAHMHSAKLYTQPKSHSQ